MIHFGGMARFANTGCATAANEAATMIQVLNKRFIDLFLF